MSLTHILILGLILVVVFGRNKLPDLGRGIGEGLRQFKKGLNGEADIDVTDSVKRLDDEENKRG
ncbi:MAG: twin-arginine translocase TatA/TatE family subunit [Bdellovibrionales bacterium]|nr:twin-arginine translocase TatA/TatE family subunit [Bdellovibrionales bacterium]